MPAPEEMVRLAPKSCFPCRKSKRKCDRKLPSCDLCLRKEVQCHYHDVGTTVTKQHSDISNLQLQPPTKTRSNCSAINAGAISFIAPQLFRQARLELPRLDMPVPSHVLSLIGDAASIRNIANTFFQFIHRWLPIISKKIFFTHLLSPLTHQQTELSLLALCMLLCFTDPPDGGAQSELYRVTKRYYFEIEATGALSIHVLQAAVLITAYEVGHAIYPAAYLTVGACARYGALLGIDRLNSDRTGKCLGSMPWVEIEERRRVWWAVLLLDRCINLNNPEKQLVTQHPTFETYLPVDDKAWDDCTTSPEDAVNISMGFNLKMGHFSRVAQATYLLSQALQSVTPITDSQDLKTDDDETEQLRRTLVSLMHLVDVEATVRRLEFCTPSAVCTSTLLLLQEHHWSNIPELSPKEDELRPYIDFLWDETRTVLDRWASTAVRCTLTCEIDPHITENISFFVVQLIYQITSLLLTIRSRSPSLEIDSNIKASLKLLQFVSKRWHLSGVYLDILGAKKVTMEADAIYKLQNVLSYSPLDSSENFNLLKKSPQNEFY